MTPFFRGDTLTERKNTFLTYGLMALGAFILAFGLYNIHTQSGITEGGILGVTLLLRHWFAISPSVSEMVLDILCYLWAFRVLGKGFAQNALVSTLLYAGFYALLERFPPLLPDLSGHLFWAAILGAVFVGVGVGLVIRAGGACCGDDALALTISHLSGWNVGRCYLFTDLAVLLLSLSYIPFFSLLWSLISVTLSSAIIGAFQRPREVEE